MIYSQEYYECKRKIENYQTKLNNLDADYQLLQECKAMLAESSISFSDLLTQCSDIKRIFDRGTIEGKYDSYQITFENKNTVFGYLDSIVSSTNNFGTNCENIKSDIDEYGSNLDEICESIADEAKEVSDTISSLMARLPYLMEPKSPE